jgi:hypothetical protein
MQQLNIWTRESAACERLIKKLEKKDSNNYAETKPHRIQEFVKSFKKWSFEEDNIILSNNTALSFSSVIATKLENLLPDRTYGAIHERIKILKAYGKDVNSKTILGTDRKWTMEEENKLLDLLKNSVEPTGYYFCANLQLKHFPNKGFQNLRFKVRSLLNLK